MAREYSTVIPGVPLEKAHPGRPTHTVIPEVYRPMAAKAEYVHQEYPKHVTVDDKVFEVSNAEEEHKLAAAEAVDEKIEEDED
jgi:hypothetical protein